MHMDLQKRLEGVDKAQENAAEASTMTKRLTMKLARVIKEEAPNYFAKQEDFSETEAVNVWAIQEGDKVQSLGFLPTMDELMSFSVNALEHL